MQFCPDACFVNALLNWKSPAENLSPKRVFWRRPVGGRYWAVKSATRKTTVRRCRLSPKVMSCCVKGEVVERQTQPPRHFTDATLLSAMTGIARSCRIKDLKDPARDRGLWTEATRAGIIELLFKRSFLTKRALHSFYRCWQSVNTFAAGNGGPSRYDRAPGICFDANQSENVRRYRDFWRNRWSARYIS